MSPDHFLWLSIGSTDKPRILTPRLSNSGLSRAIVPSSVVQTGVKSFGCENSTAQLLPIQSWKRILPWVVSASKSGAVSLIARAITHLRRLAHVVGLRRGNIVRRAVNSQDSGTKARISLRQGAIG